MLKKFDSGSIYDFCDCRNKKRRNKALKKQRVLGRNEGGNDGGECEGADCLENPIIASLWLWMREDFDWLKLVSHPDLTKNGASESQMPHFFSSVV